MLTEAHFYSVEYDRIIEKLWQMRKSKVTFAISPFMRRTTVLTSSLLLAASLTPQQVAKLPGTIWGFTFLPGDKYVLATLKKGDIYLIGIHNKELKKINHNVPSTVHGQGGLLDINVHPHYEKNKKVFLTHTYSKNGEYTTALSVGTLQQKTLQLKSKLLHVAKAYSSKGQHFGSRVVLSKTGHLFYSIGDRGERHEAQKLTTHKGKIIRLNWDGSVPKGNPFLKNKQALPEIWSYGHRNPQGLFWQSKTQKLWEQEHGPRGGDEINHVLPGKNYGWPVITYGKEYWGPSIGEGKKKRGMEQPVYQYTPSIAPSGLVVYSGKKKKAWENHFFLGALKLTHVNHVNWDGKKAGSEQRYFRDRAERVRCIREDSKGDIWYSTDGGKIYHIKIN